MRSRIIIAAVVILLSAIGLSVLSRPGSGDVEFHKKEYLEALKSRSLPKLISRGPRLLQEAYLRRQQRRIEFHRQALLTAGYLDQRDYAITNPDAEVILGDIYWAFTRAELPFFYWTASPKQGAQSTRVFHVIFLPTALERVDWIFRRLDAP